MNIRHSELDDIKDILRLIEDAKSHFRNHKINQWQDGYPNEEHIRTDIENHVSYVLEDNGEIRATICIQEDQEKIYDTINGKWICDGKYMTIHRLVVANNQKNKGYAKALFKFVEQTAAELNFKSVRSDTPEGNYIMISLMEKCGYTYCGTVIYFGWLKCVCYEKKVDNNEDFNS